MTMSRDKATLDYMRLHTLFTELDIAEAPHKDVSPTMYHVDGTGIRYRGTRDTSPKKQS